jgi:hypothetical protein
MNIELAYGAVKIARGQTLKLHDGAGTMICAREGTVWITEENSRDDVILAPGACFRLKSTGLTLVQAFADASLQVS